jgi:dTDP-4-dehydrorhamnose 3,5-epimerase
MNVIHTAIPGLLIIEPKAFDDPRGFFLEIFQEQRYAQSGISRHFVQDNLSRSARDVLRGLHIQNPRPQGKLVTVLRGCVLDVAVDVRAGSPTFGRHLTVELNDENHRQVWIPRGLAHGFVVGSQSADFFYKCDELLRWNDPALGIDWGCASPKISARDSEGSTLAQLAGRLPRYEPNANAV